MRDITLKSVKPLGKQTKQKKSVLGNLKSFKLVQNIRKNPPVKPKFIPLSRSVAASAAVSAKRLKSIPNNVKMSIDPLKSLYNLTGNRQPLVNRNNKIPVYMAHTTMDPITSLNHPPVPPAVKAKRAISGAVPPPSPSLGSANIQKTEAKLSAAMKSSARKRLPKSSSGKKLSTKKTLKKKGGKTKKAAVHGPKVTKGKKLKVIRLKRSGTKKIETKVSKMKSSGSRFSTNSKINTRATTARYYGPKLIKRLN